MNSFGRKFRVTIFGESHGSVVGVTLDGVPYGIKLSESDFTEDLSRRKSGAKGTTPRKENDEPNIVTGVFNGYTTGAPLTILFHNSNTLSGDYKNLVSHPRPGHADFVAMQKYGGYADYRGGGHFSGRLTLGLVAAGVVAKKIVPHIKIGTKISEIAGKTSGFEQLIEEAVRKQDSLGGIVQCQAEGLDVGLGEPFFDSVESLMAHLLFSIPAVKGVEFGAGFASSKMNGSQNNDTIADKYGKTLTNNAGGINGGITNGNTILFNVAFKPTPSISSPQQTFNFEHNKVEELIVKGRHDACIVLRAPVVVEAACAIVLSDLFLLSR